MEFDDLKQFIAATISQSEARLEARLETRLGAKIDKLEQKLDDGFAGIADAIEQLNNRDEDHEKRLVVLESLSS